MTNHFINHEVQRTYTVNIVAISNFINGHITNAINVNLFVTFFGQLLATLHENLLNQTISFKLNLQQFDRCKNNRFNF